MKTNRFFGLNHFTLMLFAALALSISSQARSKPSDAPKSDGSSGSSYGATVSGSQSSDPRQNPSARRDSASGVSEYSNSGTAGMRDDTVTGSTTTATAPTTPDSTTAGTGTGSSQNAGTYGSDKSADTAQMRNDTVTGSTSTHKKIRKHKKSSKRVQ